MNALERTPRITPSPPFDRSSLSPAVAVAVRMQEIYRAMSENYRRLIREHVFSREVATTADRKQLISFRRTLEGNEASSVLEILWRESSYVDERELSYAGYSKCFEDIFLTCYNLAVFLANGKEDVAATNSRVRIIIAAGAAYGLVHKKRLSRTKTLICGTEFLHKFMVELWGIKNANSCAQILLQDPGARILLAA
jgi:hypothetical protein